MLQIIETFGNLPESHIVDINASFQPGQIGALSLKNGQPVINICDGLHPIGIIDDIKSDIKRQVVWDKEIIIVPPEDTLELVSDNANPFFGKYRLVKDHYLVMEHKNIIRSSFVSDIGVELISNNFDTSVSEIKIPAGTTLNHTAGGIINNTIKFNISYAYNLKINHASFGIDDSTSGSGRATIWNENMIAKTDMFDTASKYYKYATLYVQNGFLTTAKHHDQCKSIGVVLDPPTSQNPVLEFLLDINGNIKIGTHKPFIKFGEKADVAR